MIESLVNLILSGIIFFVATVFAGMCISGIKQLFRE